MFDKKDLPEAVIAGLVGAVGGYLAFGAVSGISDSMPSVVTPAVGAGAGFILALAKDLA